MKAFVILLSSFLILSGCRTKKNATEPQAPSANEVQPTGKERKSPSPMIPKIDGTYSPNTLIIMVDTIVGKEPLYQAIKEYGATLKYDYNLISGVAIRIPEGKTLQESIAYFKKVRGVVSVSKDRITRLTDPVKPIQVEK